MTKLKRLTYVTTVFVMLLMLSVPVTLAQTGDTVGGSFTLANAAPTITSVEVIPAAGGAAVTSMTPGTARVLAWYPATARRRESWASLRLSTRSRISTSRCKRPR